MPLKMGAHCLWNLLEKLPSGGLSLFPDKRPYIDYSLRAILELTGHRVLSIKTFNTVWEMEFIGDIHYLCAAARFVNSSGRTVELWLLPRYAGTDEDWERLMMDVECSDVTVRFSLGKSRLDPLWTEAVPVDGECARLGGERVDWAEIFRRKRELLLMSVDDRADDYYDTDSLLYDAYEGDWDAWNSRNF